MCMLYLSVKLCCLVTGVNTPYLDGVVWELNLDFVFLILWNLHEKYNVNLYTFIKTSDNIIDKKKQWYICNFK